MSALIEEYSAANRVVDADLSVRYTQTLVGGVWEYETSPVSVQTFTEAWSYMRTARKSYRYVGMTKAAADMCADDMRNLYRRTVSISRWNRNNGEFSDTSGGTVDMADVSVVHVAANMWDVVINVNETDTRMRRAYHTASAMFSAEDGRDYDED